MKIGIYSESSRGTTSIGGSEFIIVVLAEYLARKHEVEIIHHNRRLTAVHMAERFGVDEQALKLRYAAREEPPASRLPWQRHQEERRWHAGLSKGYDLFIDVAHEMPPICHAGAGFLLVLFPFVAPSNVGAGGVGRSGIKSKVWIQARDAYLRQMWRTRLASYDVKAAISQFSSDWTLRRWGVKPAVFYPPCDAIEPTASKQDIILSVGRFSARGVVKKQPEMIDAFKELASRTDDWTYVCAGGLAPTEDEEAFFGSLVRQAEGLAVRLAANLSRTELVELFGRAKIFWHATGMDEDESVRPELAEHFGIVTVEAMSAGCVPVVIRKGAQPEIVEHGVSGFLWDTPDELRDYTRRLVGDSELFERMSQNARERASVFSRERFIERFEQLASPLLDA
jgi:glycosyltransferase involved in cell wall biosynthesis